MPNLAHEMENNEEDEIEYIFLEDYGNIGGNLQIDNMRGTSKTVSSKKYYYMLIILSILILIIAIILYFVLK